MPNWVSNHVQCANTDALSRLRDFSLIIPEHPAIALLPGLAAQHAAQLYQQGKSWRAVATDPAFVASLDQEQKDTPAKHRLTPARAARRYLLYCKVHGCVDWYNWRCEHWGSKWNVCHYRHHGSEVWFETALMHPWPVLEALSRQFPAEVFSVSYADEDIGSDTGTYEMQNGKLLTGGEPDDGSREAFELAFFHWGGEEDYVLRDGNYHHRDDDEAGHEDTSKSAPST